MDKMNDKVDQLWDGVCANNPQLMNDWIEGFSGDDNERKEKSKREIRNSLTDPGKNFLCRLMSTEPWLYGYRDRNGIRKRRVELGILFLRVMMGNDPYWETFVGTTLSLRNFELNLRFMNFREDRTANMREKMRHRRPFIPVDVACERTLIGCVRAR